MWIYFDTGFVSIVAKGGNVACPLQVRGRAEGDVERFLLKNPSARRDALPLVITTPNGDYRYRANVSVEWVQCSLRVIAGEITYDNFKDHTAEVAGPVRAEIYGRVWYASLELYRARRPVPEASARLRTTKKARPRAKTL